MARFKRNIGRCLGCRSNTKPRTPGVVYPPNRPAHDMTEEAKEFRRRYRTLRMKFRAGTLSDAELIDVKKNANDVRKKNVKRSEKRNYQNQQQSLSKTSSRLCQMDLKL